MYNFSVNAPDLLKTALNALDAGDDTPETRLLIAKLYAGCGMAHQARAFLKTTPSNESGALLHMLRGITPVEYNNLYGFDSIPVREEVEDSDDYSFVFCSACSYDYFYPLINLLGSIYKEHSPEYIHKIVIYDLGMLRYQREYLQDLYKVVIKDIPDYAKNWDAFFSWKYWVALDCLKEADGKFCFYIDAGVEVKQSMIPLFELAEKDGYLLFDANGHKTSKWASSVVYDYFGLDKEQDTESQTITSGIFGYQEGSKFCNILSQCLQASKIEAIMRPHSDVIDNRHDQSLTSVVLYLHSLNGVGLDIKPFRPYICGLDDGPEYLPDSYFHVCRYGRLQQNDSNLIRSR